MKLGMWTFGGIDYVIATSREEADKILLETSAYSQEEYDDLEWKLLDDNKEFSLRNEENGVEETKTVAEWVAEVGKASYFASSEY